MCGIVGAVTQREVAPILMDSLKRLEYRGYDSAGIAVLSTETQQIQRLRTQGKVQALLDALTNTPTTGHVGIAHTRWATHGAPSEINAHPHLSFDDLALVHNGIIENHSLLKQQLTDSGYQFTSQTDTEVAVHSIHQQLQIEESLLQAVHNATQTLDGAFALGIMSKKFPDRLIAVRRGSPLVIGIGNGEHFIASDPIALLPVANQFIYLEEGDIAEIAFDSVLIFNSKLQTVERKIHTIDMQIDAVSRGNYRHYMQKEIFEQVTAISDTLEGRTTNNRVLDAAFGIDAPAIFDQVERVQIVACGTSYHAGLVGRYWLEKHAGIPCQVEVASEFRYRSNVVEKNTLFVTLSQSGETADTLAALKKAQQENYLASLAICNVPASSLVRESNLVLMTRAGPEIGVASTKAFTTQLVCLVLLSIAIGRRHKLTTEEEKQFVHALLNTPQTIEKALSLDNEIKALSKRFIDKDHALFVGRGAQYPIAMEGALKLKEISYIHAEAYPAGELKHGPLALVDANMPVIAVAPNDQLQEKLLSNLHEVQARNGQLIIFADPEMSYLDTSNVTTIQLPSTSDIVAPIIYTIPLQLLAYHVAVGKGTDVDQPRNLAKSVTVE